MSDRTDDWQPIETAPTGHTQFLVVAADGRMMITSGKLLAAAMREKASSPFRFQATHWMRLPAPPARAQEAA